MSSKSNTRKTITEDNDEDEWILTYSDMVTLLMVFFILLVSFSRVDIPLYDDVTKGIEEGLAGTQSITNPVIEVYNDVKESRDTTIQNPEMARIGFDDDGIIIDFDARKLFKPGSIYLTDDAQKFLRKIGARMHDTPYDIFNIEIGGHANRMSDFSEAYPTKWELSAVRSAVVARYFILDSRISADRLIATGFADTRPAYPIVDLAGNPIPENVQRNNRVSIRLRPN